MYSIHAIARAKVSNLRPFRLKSMRKDATQITRFAEVFRKDINLGAQFMHVGACQHAYTFIMKSVRLIASKKPVEGAQPYASSGALAQHKCAVKTVSRSAVSQAADSHKSFAFVPPSAPIQVRRWPKI